MADMGQALGDRSLTSCYHEAGITFYDVFTRYPHPQTSHALPEGEWGVIL